MSMERVAFSKNGQAMPARVLPVQPAAFEAKDHTEITWLGNAGILMNVRGTVILIDPLLMGFDMPLLFDIPLTPAGVPSVDGYLVTHVDNDHFSRETVTALKDVCQAYHSTAYVAEEMKALGVPASGHGIGESFRVGPVEATLTPAKHNWQNGMPGMDFREWKEEDYCGFWLDTTDGAVWLPGDSQLLESQLRMPAPDVILFDFSDNPWHITFEGAVRLANTYPDARLICIHWGTVDAAEMSPFNGNPERLKDRVTHPERILALFPGETYQL